MAINLNTYTEKLTAKLDEEHIQSLCTGFLAGGSLNAEFATADTVIVPDFNMSGLGDYSRQAGFPKGGIAMSKRTYTLQMDRGRKFSIDIRDLATNDLKLALKGLGAKMEKFQKRFVDPEVDAFNISNIAANAGTTTSETFSGGVNGSSDKLVERLIADIDTVQEFADGEELYIMLNWNIHAQLANDATFTKLVDVGNFKKGSIDTQLKTINGAGIVKVPHQRMYTAYQYFNGVDTEQQGGGFAPTSAAKAVNWLILPKSAAECITVLTKSQVFTPDNNPDGLMYAQGYRRLFGAFVREYEKERIIVSKAA